MEFNRSSFSCLLYTFSDGIFFLASSSSFQDWGKENRGILLIASENFQVFPYNLSPKASQTPPSSPKGIFISLYPLPPQQGGGGWGQGGSRPHYFPPIEQTTHRNQHTITEKPDHQHAKKVRKTLILLFCDFFLTFYLWRLMYQQRNFEKNLLFVGILSATCEKSRIWIRIHKSVIWISGSRAVPKFQGSTTMHNRIHAFQ